MTNHLKTIGTAIRAARLQSGLSQDELADRAGLHRTYIGGVERGERNLGILNFLRIAEALGVAPSTLLRSIDHNLGANKK